MKGFFIITFTILLAALLAAFTYSVGVERGSFCLENYDRLDTDYHLLRLEHIETKQLLHQAIRKIDQLKGR